MSLLRGGSRLMLGVALACAAAVPRLLGGLSVLHRRDRLHLAMGFAAGALLAVAGLDTLPEALHRAPAEFVFPVVLVGCLLFSWLERSVFGHLHTEDRACHPRAGYIGAGGITAHAFMDGLAIGAAFRVSSELGIVVSMAVLLHAFADGLNTVTVILGAGHPPRRARAWLCADMVAPALGAGLALLVALPSLLLAGLLAAFAGLFLSLAAGSLLPAAHRSGRDRGLVAASALSGALLVGLATQLG